MAEGNLVGDPIEKQAFEGIKFQHDGKRTSCPKIGNYPKIVQMKRFLFESALKRQSAIVHVHDGITRNGFLRVLCKGAPEVVEKYLKDVPEGYRDSYIHFVKNGARVLVMAYKDIKTTADKATQMTREEAESDLTFCGFIVSECPLKEDTKAVIEELVESGHEVKMITGDNQLTAAFVAHQLNFAPRSNNRSLFVSGVIQAQGTIKWSDLDDKQVAVTKNPEEVAKLAKKNLLCVTGEYLSKIFMMEQVGKNIRHIQVFSRTSPNQKTAIVAQLNREGNMTLMTGDGTNDVGSLKRADVGLAIVNNPPPSKEDKKKKKSLSMWPAKEKLQGLDMAAAKKVMEEHQKEYQKVMMANAGDPSLELGDACIAAPFTYKFTSLKSVKRLIREGRKTLTTTFQMYKILSLNSLISAYTMSALYLDGVKMGDYQATYMGMGLSFLFIFLNFT
jgi:cation-transporting ATPase 13A1